MSQEHTNCHVHSDHTCSLWAELFCHLPYAVFSVAFGLIVLSFFDFASGSDGVRLLAKKTNILFHSFHFLHIVFAVSGSFITFVRFSANLFKGSVIAVVTSLFFCTLSDVVLPFIGGKLLGMNMHFHFCLQSELHNVLPFVALGLLNGIVMSRNKSTSHAFFSMATHFGHIFISSLAALFYLVSQGLTNWYPSIGFVFVFLVMAVVIPCTLSDVIVPVFVARSSRGK